MPNPPVAWVVPLFGSLRGILLELYSPRRRERARATRARFSFSRAFITILCDRARHRERRKEVGEGKGCLSQREESFMGDYGAARCAEGLPKRFYPTFKRGQQMPWHVRSTDASRRAAFARRGCDRLTSRRKFAFPAPRDDRQALLLNNVTETTAAGSWARATPRGSYLTHILRSSNCKAHARDMRAIAYMSDYVNWPYIIKLQ